MKTTFIHPLLASYLCALTDVDITRGDPNTQIATALKKYLSQKNISCTGVSELNLSEAVEQEITAQEKQIIKLLADQGGIDIEASAPYLPSKGFSVKDKVNFTEENIKGILRQSKELSFNIPMSVLKDFLGLEDNPSHTQLVEKLNEKTKATLKISGEYVVSQKDEKSSKDMVIVAEAGSIKKLKVSFLYSNLAMWQVQAMVYGEEYQKIEPVNGETLSTFLTEKGITAKLFSKGEKGFLIWYPPGDSKKSSEQIQQYVDSNSTIINENQLRAIRHHLAPQDQKKHSTKSVLSAPVLSAEELKSICPDGVRIINENGKLIVIGPAAAIQTLKEFDSEEVSYDKEYRLLATLIKKTQTKFSLDAFKVMLVEAKQLPEDYNLRLETVEEKTGKFQALIPKKFKSAIESHIQGTLDKYSLELDPDTMKGLIVEARKQGYSGKENDHKAVLDFLNTKNIIIHSFEVYKREEKSYVIFSNEKDKEKVIDLKPHYYSLNKEHLLAIEMESEQKDFIAGCQTLGIQVEVSKSVSKLSSGGRPVSIPKEIRVIRENSKFVQTIESYTVCPQKTADFMHSKNQNSEGRNFNKDKKPHLLSKSEKYEQAYRQACDEYKWLNQDLSKFEEKITDLTTLQSHVNELLQSVKDARALFHQEHGESTKLTPVPFTPPVSTSSTFHAPVHFAQTMWNTVRRRSSGDGPSHTSSSTSTTTTTTNSSQ